MADISVQFTNRVNGYDKDEVDEFVRAAESRLQEKAIELSELQSQVTELENKLTRLKGADMAVVEKLEIYDRLMKKMDGDYKNLLAPAVAKAKSIEEKAEKEYQARIDQARYTAEGIYAEAADRIAGVVDDNMDRIYGLIGDYIKSRTLIGRIKSFARGCKIATQKVSSATKSAGKKVSGATKRAGNKVKRFSQRRYSLVSRQTDEGIAFELMAQDPEV